MSEEFTLEDEELLATQKEEEEEDEEDLIEQWKDTRLRKLEDFSKEMNSSRKVNFMSAGMSSRRDQEEEEEFLLTKTEGTLRVPSTQRSSSRNEFEQKITDIKSKLTQIKNTINEEIEHSFKLEAFAPSPVQNKPSVFSSIDNFQGRLNVIKANLNESKEETDKERVESIRRMLDASFKPSPAKSMQS